MTYAPLSGQSDNSAVFQPRTVANRKKPNFVRENLQSRNFMVPKPSRAYTHALSKSRCTPSVFACLSVLIIQLLIWELSTVSCLLCAISLLSVSCEWSSDMSWAVSDFGKLIHWITQLTQQATQILPAHSTCVGNITPRNCRGWELERPSTQLNSSVL